jgi:hypothetical protein
LKRGDGVQPAAESGQRPFTDADGWHGRIVNVDQIGLRDETADVGRRHITGNPPANNGYLHGKIISAMAVI